MKTRRRQCSRKSKILLEVLVLVAIVGFGTATYAASFNLSTDLGSDPTSLFDPFTLSRVTSVIEGESIAEDVNGQLFVDINTKHVTKRIWVPKRPALRSPIRPSFIY